MVIVLEVEDWPRVFLATLNLWLLTVSRFDCLPSASLSIFSLASCMLACVALIVAPFFGDQ